MKKTQLFLIVVGVLGVWGLYSLPKYVVDNEGQAAVAEKASDASSPADPQTSHTATLEEQEEQSLLDLRKQAVAGTATLEELEELAGLYRKKSLYDSSGYFLGKASEQSADLEWKEKAGDAYYEAFSFALDAEKVERTAGLVRAFYEAVLEKDASRNDLKSKIAMTYVSSSNPMQGIMMLREILEEDPQNEEALYNMGILSMQSGQYKRAVDRFEDLVRFYPDNLQGQFYLGVSYFESKQQNKAKSQFEVVQRMTQDLMILESIQDYLDRL